MTMHTDRTLAELDFLSPEIIEDPHAANAVARRDAPVHHLPGTAIYMVSTYELIAEACANAAVFSNDFGSLLEGRAREDAEIKSVIAQGWPQVKTLLTADPPSHTRFRKLVSLAFSPLRVNRIEGSIEAVVDELIGRFVRNGRCEFVAEFAVPLPVTVIADQIGVPRSDVAQLKQWSDAVADRLGGMLTRDQELDCAHKIVALQHYMKARLDERREHPTDDLLSDLVNARLADERPLDTAELLNVVQQFLVAGNETTTNALTAGMLHLIQNPGEFAKVAANPALIKTMIEEVLRLESPTNSMWRMVKEDVKLGGVAIPKGSMVLLRFGSGNRDAAKFADPDRFDVTRSNAHLHLAFGRGIHSCVGAMLSRKEMQVAFRRLLQRLGNPRLARGNDLKHHNNLLLRGLKRLEIEFDGPLDGPGQAGR
jgi:cytochrome P450